MQDNFLFFGGGGRERAEFYNNDNDNDNDNHNDNHNNNNNNNNNNNELYLTREHLQQSVLPDVPDRDIEIYSASIPSHRL